MVAAGAEVVAADMEEEIVNVTDAETSATFLGIARIPNVVAAVEMTMRPTTDKQEQDEWNIFSFGVEMSCNLQTGGFFILVCRFEFRITNLITRW